MITVRPAISTDASVWLTLRDRLWPDSKHDHAVEIEVYFQDPPETEACLVAELPGQGIVGFAEVGLRKYAEGCLSSPVGYLEGIFVVSEHRRTGVGRELVAAGEEWARALGCTEMASDREIANEASGAFHEAEGYDEVERIVCYRKSLVAREIVAPGVSTLFGPGGIR